MTSVAAGTVNRASMADINDSKVWLHFSKCDADYARCNICDAKCRASSGNTSNLRKHLVQPKIFLVSLRSTATASSFGTVSTPASISSLSSAASNMGEEMFETTEMLQDKQMDAVLIYSFKFIYGEINVNSVLFNKHLLPHKHTQKYQKLVPLNTDSQVPGIGSNVKGTHP
ncbi:hypothetical protein GOODEAATRI_007382 [Goodea atripinnis]|uniref:BED-type domain-containing protein n=1 Tax=Goodea atripinnis TaxID=208336 RepID=A0ABV0MFV2_9TELE